MSHPGEPPELRKRVSNFFQWDILGNLKGISDTYLMPCYFSDDGVRCAGGNDSCRCAFMYREALIGR